MGFHSTMAPRLAVLLLTVKGVGLRISVSILQCTAAQSLPCGWSLLYVQCGKSLGTVSCPAETL